MCKHEWELNHTEWQFPQEGMTGTCGAVEYAFWCRRKCLRVIKKAVEYDKKTEKKKKTRAAAIYDVDLHGAWRKFLTISLYFFKIVFSWRARIK